MGPMKPTTLPSSDWIQIGAGLGSAVVGVVGTNVLRILSYPSTPLLVVFILVWVWSWIYLTATYWRVYGKLAKPPYLSITTLISPIISTALLLFWLWQARTQASGNA